MAEGRKAGIVKAVSFDWGGVLGANSRKEVLRHIADSFGTTIPKIETQLSKNACVISKSFPSS